MDPLPAAGSGAADSPVVVTDLADVLGPVAEEPSRAELLARVSALEGKLVSLPAIEQAKGALMATYGLTADAAFALLRFHSQTRNVKIRAIASQLTALMSTSASGAEGIARFNRLLDQAADDETSAARASAAQVDPDASAPPVARGPNVLGPVIAAAELPGVTVRAVSAAPPGITIAGNDPDLPLVFATKAFTLMTGYPMREVLGRNCRFLQGADTDPRDVAAIREALRHGRDVSVVLRNYRSDGVPFWNEVSISPIRNRANQVTHYIGTQIDVTNRTNQAGFSAR